MDRSTSLTAAGLLTALILGAVALRGPEGAEPVRAAGAPVRAAGAPVRARAAQPAARGEPADPQGVVPAVWITGALPGGRDVSLAVRRTAR